MSIDLSRSIHPDLLDEYQQQIDLAAGTQTTPDAPARRRRRGRGATEDAAASPPGGEQATQDPVASTEGSEEAGSLAASPEPTAPTEPPEWLAQARAANDPTEMLKLLVRNVPRDEMEKDDTLRGWLGDAAQQRARRMLEDQERQRVEREKAAAFDRGDVYTLGQQAAAELQAQRQAALAQHDPYLVAIRNFQAKLPEAVQREVQGKQYASYQDYLEAVHDAAIRHGVAEETSKRASALNKAALSSTVGSEQSPELDGGPSQAYREITDAQVAAMTLEEYDRYFDEKGRPKPGVRVRLERAIDVRRR